MASAVSEAGASSASARPADAGRRWSPYARAALVVGIALVFTSLFVASYVNALGHPTARAVDVAVVGPPGAQQPFVDALEAATSHGLTITRYPSVIQAEAAVDRQEVSAVLVLDPVQPVQLELSSASGSSVARLLSQLAPRAAQQAAVEVRTTDLHPLPAADPQGLTAFYVVIGATILGFVTTFQLVVNAKPLQLVPWLAVTAALAVLGGGVLSPLVHVVLGVPIPLLPAWGLVSLMVLTASTFAATMSVLLRRWALLPTWLLFFVLGNTSSGGAVAPSLLPEPFSSLSRWLPQGAAVSALRSAAYLPDSGYTEPVLVLAAWAAASTAALVVASLRVGRSPAQDPPRP